jgi:hypothetical protein
MAYASGGQLRLIPGTGVVNGQTLVAIPGAAEVLAAAQAIISVTIIALPTNTGLIYVGNAGVNAANGTPRNAEQSITLDVDSLDDVWIDAAVGGEGVAYIAVLP